MRRLSILCVAALAGCRGLLGIDDPTVGADAVIEADAPVIDADPCGAADFDMDGIPDGCDPCPMVSAAFDHTDSDGDGIDDACDPRPNEAGDTRLLWTTFDAPSTIATWTTNGGSWSITNKGLTQADTAATGRFQMPGTTFDHVALYTQLEILGLGTDPQAGFCTNVGPTSYRCCDVQPAGPTLLAWDPVSQSTGILPGPLGVGTKVLLQLAPTTLDHTCRVAISPNLVTVTHPGSDTVGGIVVHMRQIGVAYRYLFVVQEPP